MPGGLLHVEEILQKQKNLRDYTVDDVQRVVQNETKQRFCIETDPASGRLKIRANQGHSMQIDDLQLQPILNEHFVLLYI